MQTPSPTPRGVIRTRKKEHIGYIVFDNISKFNAVNYEMWVALPNAIRDFEEDSNVRLIVLTGAGDKAFVSGGDISQFDATDAGKWQTNYNRTSEAGYASVLNCTKPTLARINGVCMGGGMTLALNCDLRICSDASKFRMPAARLGLGYPHEGVKRFLEVIGVANAADIVMTARVFDGDHAKSIGMVNSVVPTAKFSETADDLEKQIIANAPLTLFTFKKTLLELRKSTHSQDIEMIQKLIDSCYLSSDYAEGCKAFLEKRVPDFLGR
jgi:enoyl-CoA hydratase/carnithine racemase